MPIKYTDDKGVTQEVYTKEELDAQVKSANDNAAKIAAEAATAAAAKALEEYKAANPTGASATEVEKLRNDLAEKEAALAAATAGEGNAAQIARLRAERDEATRLANEGIAKIRAEMDEFKNANVADTKSKLLDKFSGGNAENRKKIEYEFDRYDPTNTSPEGIQARMEKAVSLAGVSPAPRSVDVLNGGGARGDGGTGGGRAPVEVTTNAVNIGKALGVTEADLKAHAEKKNG